MSVRLCIFDAYLSPLQTHRREVWLRFQLTTGELYWLQVYVLYGDMWRHLSVRTKAESAIVKWTVQNVGGGYCIALDVHATVEKGKN